MRNLSEKFEYDNLVMHLKHIVEYEDDARFRSKVEKLKDAIVSFGNTYDYYADELASSPASSAYDDSADVVGYLGEGNRVVKYDRRTRDFVVYVEKGKNNYVTVTMHKKNERQFQHIRDRDFVSELPENQENFEDKKIK